MKAAPVMRALTGRPDVRQSLVHTGQHYDANMSDIFFQQLAIPEPDVNLGVGSSSHARQTAEIMTRFESVLLERMPDKVIVYGDVNSTLAASLVCAKLQIEVVHVEAGLRSFDRTMPEEVNRIVTDRLADVLFTPSRDADSNLLAEGIEVDRICNVGNVMIDSLIELLPAAAAVPRNGLPDSYVLVTLHRPSNVDDSLSLRQVVELLLRVSTDIPVVFPAHPRTKQRLAGLNLDLSTLHLLDPLPYIEFVALEKSATAVITDSGGIQEETTYLGIPCLTLRDNTERPITVEIGTNVLVGRGGTRLLSEMNTVLRGKGKRGDIPPLWDGRASQRISHILCGAPNGSKETAYSAQVQYTDRKN